MCWKCDRKFYLHWANIIDKNYPTTKVFYREEAEKLYPEEETTCDEWKEK